MLSRDRAGKSPGEEMFSEVFGAYKGGPLIVKGPSDSLSLLRDDWEARGEARGEEPAPNAGSLY